MRRGPRPCTLCEMTIEDSQTVWIDLGCRGHWEVLLSDRSARVSCETLEEARRVGYVNAGQGYPCELIVRDAYHRVIARELIDGSPDHSVGLSS